MSKYKELFRYGLIAGTALWKELLVGSLALIGGLSWYASISSDIENPKIASEVSSIQSFERTCRVNASSNASDSPKIYTIPWLPPLDNADDVRYTDNGSKEIIVNVWDNDHDDLDLQQRIAEAKEEIVRKWDISLIGEEGYFGLPNGIPPLCFIKPKSYDRETVTVGFDVLAGKAVNFLVLAGKANVLLSKTKENADRCYKKTNDTSCYDVLRYPDLVSFLDEVEREVKPFSSFNRPDDLRDLETLSLDLGDYKTMVDHLYRSYASVDSLLGFMGKFNKNTALMVFGEGHYLQVNDYLNLLGISHVDVILDKDMFDAEITEDSILSGNTLAFSYAELDFYTKHLRPQIESQK